MSIKLLEDSLIKKIHTEHTIKDIKSIFKELFENSLDSGATEIIINLKNYGLEKFEVSDNGCGIQEKDFEKLCTRGATSKLKDYGDKENVTGMGFRGEALYAICNFAELTISTKSQNPGAEGFSLKFDNGAIVETKKMSRKPGTTVTLNSLFKRSDARRMDFEKKKSVYLNEIVDY